MGNKKDIDGSVAYIAALIRRNKELLWLLAWEPWEDRGLKITDTKQTETCHNH